MSTSLNKDLHSVYIDGEMPEGFLSQYEAIVNQDEKEKARLEKMQVLHNLLQEDSDNKTVSDEFLNASFERLQTKMRYAKTIDFAKESNSSFIKPFAKYAASFVAAAAVFAVIFIPVHTSSLKNAKETAVAAIKIMKQDSIEPIAKKDVIVDGSINKEDLPKVLSSSSVAKTENTGAGGEVLPREQKTISATSLVSSGNGSTIARNLREQLTAVDPFIPDFSSSPIQITITIPNFGEIGNNMPINQEE
ncbi:MAG: hypothetical protein IJ630_12720 [Treponema sp.]|nr:hypothetical protein [Treponema sp.]